MHSSSYECMQKAKTLLYEGNNSLALKILDVGGRLHPKRMAFSYANLFADICGEYRVADIKGGLNVTDVMPGPYTLPFESDTFDLIVCGQVLEHVKNPFRSVAEMVRVLKSKGKIVLIAPSTGKYHGAPFDCWRFMDDAFQAIAEESGLKTIADWVEKKPADKRSRRWCDHAFIGEKLL